LITLTAEGSQTPQLRFREERRQKVLVVDDDTSAVSILKRLLGEENLEVATATNAEEALDLVEKMIPDLFLLNIMMPGMDGFELARTLQQDERLIDVPVIFLSASMSLSDHVKSLDCGAVDFICKPFRLLEVIARVRAHIHQREALLEKEHLRRLALEANPLTLLPGNNTINRRIQVAIDQREPASVIYCDLDNFKTYNDLYGFSAGDQLILFAARTFCEAINKVYGKGFIGHIGGDDFVLLVPSVNVEALGDEIIHSFDASVAGFYNHEDRGRGYVVSTNRQGELLHLPFVTVTMAGVRLDQKEFNSFIEVSEVCAEIKRMGKSLDGSNLLLDRRAQQEKTRATTGAGGS
jgi:PleD family two-component response regulator